MENEMAMSSQDEIIEIRKDKLISFLKKNYDLVTYIILAVVVLLAVRIRTLNLPGLKDVTTGTWTLGPDLDPFLFLRWSQYIVEHGKLMAIDTMRYVPLGYSTHGELILHPYMMAWFHKGLSLLGLSESVNYSAIIYPVFFFALTVIAFFFLTRKIFIDQLGKLNANVMALVASLFLTIMPSLLPRTIAGIPEKESVAFFFMFVAFYFFISAWKSKTSWKKYSLALLAGLSTAAMALSWGGYPYITLTIALASFLAFFFFSLDKKSSYIYTIWIVSACVLMSLFSSRYVFSNLFSSFNTLVPIATAFLLLFHHFIFAPYIGPRLKNTSLKKWPPQLISSILVAIIGIAFLTVVSGPTALLEKTSQITRPLITPIQDRVGVTVAENRQPFFTEWAESFGPYVSSIPLTFWLFFFGSLVLFAYAFKNFGKKEKWTLTLAFTYFLFAVIFSRYSASSSLNGTNIISLVFYTSGFLVLIAAFASIYIKNYNLDKTEKFKELDFAFILLFALYFLSILSARGSVRTIMILVPAASIMISFLIVFLSDKTIKSKRNNKFNLLYLVITLVILLATLFSAYSFYRSTSATAAQFAPDIYTQQWQKAMSWVRENTPENAVFAHWWDYGYWLQSIGKRATVLDGGNAIAYWNHFMGRYALTGTNNTEALEFLYTHNATYFLIDATDIGKYSAFSSIGSDVNYDRASFIPLFQRDLNQVQERKNSTVFIYPGGTVLDEDIIYEMNGTRIFLPTGRAGIAGILIERNSAGDFVSAPIGIFVYENKQYEIPLKYVYANNSLMEFKGGIEAGVFLIPRAISNAQGVQIESEGSLLYLSERTVKSQLARLYLYNENNEYFKLVHSEPDFVVTQIKAQTPAFQNEFLDYGGLRGPIRIWEVSYPDNIRANEEFLSTVYPPELLAR